MKEEAVTFLKDWIIKETLRAYHQGGYDTMRCAKNAFEAAMIADKNKVIEIKDVIKLLTEFEDHAKKSLEGVNNDSGQRDS